MRRLVSTLACVALAGCVAETKVELPPMPRMLPTPVADAPPPPTTAQQVAIAEARAEQGDASGVARAFDPIPVGERERAAREFFGKLAARDAVRAANLAAALPDGTLQEVALAAALGTFVARDADAAVAWALARPEATARFAPLRALAETLVAHDARTAVAHVLALPATSGRDELLTLLAARWARTDAPAALAWARDLPAGETRTRMLTSVGIEIAQREPARAIAVAELLPEQRNRWILLGTIARTWVARDRAAALAWAQTQPAGPAREAALAGIDTGLGVTPLHGVELESIAAAAPARGRESDYGFQRDERLRRRFDDLLRASPAQAALWLDGLPAADRSDQMVQQLTREWFATNPVAARQWLDQNVMSEAQKRQLLEDSGVHPPHPPR